MIKSSITTELDDILLSIDESDENLDFFLGVMRELKLEISPYSEKDAILIRKSQNGEISDSENQQLEIILKKSQDEADELENKVKSYLYQSNRTVNVPQLMIH